MQFIRLPKLINIAERELPELVADWMNTKSVQNINMSFSRKLWVIILISWVIECSTSWMPHRRTIGNFTPRPWAKRDLSNPNVFWTIPDPGSQKRITLLLESISTIPFQSRTSYVKIPEWGHHCSNRRMPCHICIFDTFWGTSNQPNENPGALHRCTADIFLNITNGEIQQPGMLIAWKTGQVSLVRCTNDRHNRRSGRKMILPIAPVVVHVHLGVYSVTFPVCERHRF